MYDVSCSLLYYGDKTIVVFLSDCSLLCVEMDWSKFFVSNEWLGFLFFCMKINSCIFICQRCGLSMLLALGYCHTTTYSKGEAQCMVNWLLMYCLKLYCAIWMITKKKNFLILLLLHFLCFDGFNVLIFNFCITLLANILV